MICVISPSPLSLSWAQLRRELLLCEVKCLSTVFVCLSSKDPLALLAARLCSRLPGNIGYKRCRVFIECAPTHLVWLLILLLLLAQASPLHKSQAYTDATAATFISGSPLCLLVLQWPIAYGDQCCTIYVRTYKANELYVRYVQIVVVSLAVNEVSTSQKSRPRFFFLSHSLTPRHYAHHVHYILKWPVRSLSFWDAIIEQQI